jgi:ABC-type sugar transport system permease subunit/ABC-type glycerol-3-phosphate transport system substrate-binding protein
MTVLLFRILTIILFFASFTVQAKPIVFRTTDFAPEPDSAFSIFGKAELAVYQAFIKKYPDIQPESNPLGLQFDGAAGEAPLLMSLAGGTAPEVIHVNTRQSGSFAGRGFVHALDAFIDLEQTAEQARAADNFDPDIMYRDEFEARVSPPLRDAVYREGPDGKKHVYWLPFSNWYRVLAYNKYLFREAGIDPENGYPKTWDELMAVGRILQKPEQDSYGILLDTSGGASWIALPFFYSMGSQIVTRDAKGDWWAAFNDPGSIEAADFYLQLVDGPWKDATGKQRYGIGHTANPWQQWTRGRLGMTFLYINDTLINIDDLISSSTANEVGLVPVPQSYAGTSTTELHVRGLGITTTTTDPEIIRAAWRFVRFVGSPEAQSAVVRTYVENGYGRFIDPVKLAQYGYPEYAASVPTQWANTLHYAMEHCRPEPYGKNCQAYILRASKPLETAVDEKLPREPNKEVRLARLQELYDEAVAEVNEKMLGQIPPEKMKQRRWAAGAILAFMISSFGWLFVYIWRIFTPQAGEATRRPGSRSVMALLLLAPALLTILIFNYYPLLRGAVMAFQDVNVLGGSTFVGLDNFASVLFDKVFWISILRTFEYVFWSLLFVFSAPIVLALILSEIPLGKVFFRVVYYLPAVLSGLVVMLMWKMFFEPTEAGLFNQVLGWWGIEPQRWLHDKSLAMISILLPLGWAGLGPGCLIYLAALKTVPDDLYEAAAIDGAGIWKRVWHVTLPTIRPLMLIQLIFVLIGAFQSADNVLVMTGGGPDYATHVTGLEIFYSAYVYQRFGTAIAIAWILGFLLIGLTMWQMKRISNMTFTTAAAD